MRSAGCMPNPEESELVMLNVRIAMLHHDKAAVEARHTIKETPFTSSILGSARLAQLVG